MAVGEDKVRTNITFPKELKSELEEIKTELKNISQMRVYWQFASLRSWLFSFLEKTGCR